MIKNHEIPRKYCSKLVSGIKSGVEDRANARVELSPYILDLGPLVFKIAKRFGFCFGVENAIGLAYQAIEENPDKKIFLLSEMIHNQQVNEDLKSKGVRFIFGKGGKELVPINQLTPEDVVIVPAFGTTVQLLRRFEEIGVDLSIYDTTCPFVKRVWKRAEELALEGYTVVIHGKDSHEETRATFSHASSKGPVIVVKNIDDAKKLAVFITNPEHRSEDFNACFRGLVSDDFDSQRDLRKIGVVNQTTMLASQTIQIGKILREAVVQAGSGVDSGFDFADTQDTMCYATSTNQEAARELIKDGGDLAVVVGGYNSSNTTHLARLCSEGVRTFHIKDAGELIDLHSIRHLDPRTEDVIISKEWLPTDKRIINCLITAGASCPDSLVESVITKISSFLGVEANLLENR